MTEHLEDTEHPSFRIPANRDVRIWRYMDLAKYLDLLQRRSLFFARATSLGDPFEGSSTKAMVAAREFIMQNRSSDPNLVQFKDLPENFFAILSDGYRRMVQEYLISCWHVNEHESAAMWSLYLKSGEGVCIQSTYRRLRSCLPKCVLIGQVNYIDYNTEGFSADNAFNFIVHKRKSFEHERELRAIFWAVDGTPEAQPYKERIEKVGLWIDVNLSSLIETVQISPAAEPWLAKVIQEVTAKYDLPAPVSQSALAESPLY
jgi:hypothetical protein